MAQKNAASKAIGGPGAAHENRKTGKSMPYGRLNRPKPNQATHAVRHRAKVGRGRIHGNSPVRLATSDRHVKCRASILLGRASLACGSTMKVDCNMGTGYMSGQLISSY